MPAFLFIATMIGGIAFANQGLDKCIEANGAKACFEQVHENRVASYKVND